jgi:hypothetical protein
VVHCAGLSDFSVRGAARRHFSRPVYKVIIVQAYQTPQYMVPRGGIFLVQYTRCSLCRLTRLLSTWCRGAEFFSSIYKLFIVQAYQTSQYMVPRGGIFLVQYTTCSLCRLTRLLSTWCRAGAFFSASGAALSDGKMNVQSVCALNTRYNQAYILTRKNCFITVKIKQREVCTIRFRNLKNAAKRFWRKK